MSFELSSGAKLLQSVSVELPLNYCPGVNYLHICFMPMLSGFSLVTSDLLALWPHHVCCTYCDSDSITIVSAQAQTCCCTLPCAFLIIIGILMNYNIIVIVY